MTVSEDASFWDYFLVTLYTTELSNLFLMLHSATNWLLLINYRTYDSNKKKTESNVRTSSVG